MMHLVREALKQTISLEKQQQVGWRFDFKWYTAIGSIGKEQAVTRNIVDQVRDDV